MRILIISAAYPPMEAGEASNTFYLCEHLADRNMDVHVVTNYSNGAVWEGKATVHRLRSWSWSDLPRFIRVLRDCSPDAILLFYIPWIYRHHPMITYAPTISKSLLRHVPFVTRFENAIDRRVRRWPIVTRCLRKGVTLWAGMKDVDYQLGTLLRDSDRIIVLAKQHLDYLAKRYPGVEEKGVVIPPPPNMRICEDNNGTLRMRGREILDVKGGDFVFVYLGYIYPSKGIGTLLRAFERVSNERSDVRLIIVGGSVDLQSGNHPWHVDELHGLSKQLGIDKKVTWTGGYKWDEEKASMFLRAADACVLPFDSGVQMNNSSFSSAASHGLPIVTTRGVMLEESFIHEKNVLLCSPKSPEALAEAMKRVMYEDDLRERLRSSVVKLAEEWFSWDGAIDRTIATFSRHSYD